MIEEKLEQLANTIRAQDEQEGLFFKEMNVFIQQAKSTMHSRNRWKRAALFFIGCTIGLLVRGLFR